MPPDFVPGLELSARLYRDAVRPLLDRYVHSAALLGPGSEVLGFDTVRSTDHDWGPRLIVFLRAEDDAATVTDLLADRLPATLAGYPTNFVAVGEGGTRHMRPTRGRLQHGVVVTEPGAWLTERLGFDPRGAVTTFDWLATTTQALAEVTGGAVFHDGLGCVGPVRRALAWYPADVWRYVLACQWRRVAQEEPFVGRCGEVGDELGSAIVAARLARDLMRLWLLTHRRYPPYGKWLGSAFARTPGADRLGGALTAAVAATDWRDREDHLVTAYETVAARHNELGLTAPLEPRVRWFHDRPFRVAGGDRFAMALVATITDPALRARPLTGAIDQFVDSTEVLADAARARRVAGAG